MAIYVTLFLKGIPKAPLKFSTIIHKIIKGQDLSTGNQNFGMTRNLVAGEALQVFEHKARERGTKKCKIWVGDEGPHLPLLPSKGDSYPEEVPQAGAVKTPQHQETRLHLSHWRYYWMPQQVPSRRGGKTTTRIRHPWADRFINPEGVAKVNHHTWVWLRNPRPHGAHQVLWAPKNWWGNIPDAGWRKSPKQKTKQSSECHQTAKSAQSKG